jgi:hypothetical protein
MVTWCPARLGCQQKKREQCVVSCKSTATVTSNKSNTFHGLTDPQARGRGARALACSLRQPL